MKKTCDECGRETEDLKKSSHVSGDYCAECLAEIEKAVIYVDDHPELAAK